MRKALTPISYHIELRVSHILVEHLAVVGNDSLVHISSRIPEKNRGNILITNIFTLNRSSKSHFINTIAIFNLNQYILERLLFLQQTVLIHSTITAMESFIYWEKFFFKFKFTKSSGNVNRAKVARKDVFFDVLSSHKGTHRYSEFSVKQLVS